MTERINKLQETVSKLASQQGAQVDVQKKQQAIVDQFEKMTAQVKSQMKRMDE